ncbi:MAG TPA: hypothetical protein DC049_15085, partial [Spirochaetia bacterium]|nr:hypothetical protein [Spirochaetia bacterium]
MKMKSLNCSGNKILFITGYGGRYGSGHFIRSRRFAAGSGECAVLLLLKPGKKPEYYSDFQAANWDQACKMAAEYSPSAVVFDCREIPSGIVKKIRSFSAVIIIDSRGGETVLGDIIVSSLMLPCANLLSNFTGLPYL